MKALYSDESSCNMSEGSQKQQTYELVRLSYYGKTLLIYQTLSNSRLLLVK